MNLRLQNPFRGSLQPWPLASRVLRFVFTAVALAFVHVSSRMLRSLVRRRAGLADPQELPVRPRRWVEWLCHAATALAFLGIAYRLTGQGTGLGLFALAGILWAGAAWYLGRTVWGLPNAFRDRTGRIGAVFRRLVEVIRHGHP